MGTTLPPERMPAALRSISAWRANPDAAVPCPSCGTSGLKITDRSARPHAEWYELSCPACGLAHTIHIPIPGTMGGHDV